MQGRKLQLKTNICANVQENTEYQDSGGMLVFDGMTLLSYHLSPRFSYCRFPEVTPLKACIIISFVSSEVEAEADMRVCLFLRVASSLQVILRDKNFFQ
jgi:hypothetical protein